MAMTEGREPPHSPAAALQPGTLVAARYEILGRVGEGGMGVVYRARDRSLDEIVAIKVLRPQLVGSPLMAQRFRAEIKLARRVTHKNVCRIHDYGEDGTLAFISMELVEGADLKTIVREQRELTLDETFDIARQLADGLQAIHDEGIIHRDFKTANVMIDRRGTVRLMDFGIAKLWESESAEGLTLQGQTAGTPEYMSPEQASGQALDPRSDVYSLGIVLFELFTGIRPFAADHLAAVIYKQLHEEPPWSAPRAASMAPGLQAVIRKALAKRREDRFASVSELRGALEESRGGLPPISSDAAETLVVRVQALDASGSGRLAPAAAAPAVAPSAVPPARTASSRGLWIVLAIGAMAVVALVSAGVLAWRSFSTTAPPAAASTVAPAPGAPKANPAGSDKPIESIHREPVREPAKDSGRTANVATDTSAQGRCDGGDMDACFALAQEMETGQGGQKDPERAARLYLKACDAGMGAACTQLGVLHNSGLAGPRDLALAAVHYERGCKLGDMAGCSNLGTLYQYGMVGFGGDRAKAEALYEQACAAGHADACTNLAVLYLDDSASSADRRTRARGLLTKACTAGVARACQRLERR